MNSGIHDAYDLAVHTHRVMHHSASLPHALVDDEQVCRAFAMNDMQLSTNKNCHDMSATETDYFQRHNYKFATAAANPRLAYEFLLRAAIVDPYNSLFFPYL
ncbi:MAG: hypothetical protein WCL57_14370 [Chloroflexota bacterium]